MEKYKYHFFDLMGRALQFPADANGIVNEKVKALKCQILQDTIKKAETIRAYGNIQVFDNKNAPICSIEFHSGVVKTYNLIDNPEKTEIYLPLRVVFLRSYRNDAWSFKKQNESGAANG
jgi:hypothetical protein